MISIFKFWKIKQMISKGEYSNIIHSSYSYASLNATYLNNNTLNEWMLPDNLNIFSIQRI